MDESNINEKFLNSRFAKVNQVMDFWMSRKENDQVDYLESLKFSLLKLKAKCREIAVYISYEKSERCVAAIRDYLGPSSARADSEELYLQAVNEAVPIVRDRIESLRQKQERNFMIDEQELQDFTDIKAKILKKGCDIHENILRWYKSKAELQELTLSKLPNKNYLLEHAMNLLYPPFNLAGG